MLKRFITVSTPGTNTTEYRDKKLSVFVKIFAIFTIDESQKLSIFAGLSRKS